MALSKPSDEDKIDRSSSIKKKKKDPVRSLKKKLIERHRNKTKPLFKEVKKMGFKDKSKEAFDKRESIIEKLESITKGTEKDLDLIDDYGVDAPRSRGFMTDYDRPQKKAGGGKVRGAGAALGGYGKGPYSNKLI